MRCSAPHRNAAKYGGDECSSPCPAPDPATVAIAVEDEGRAFPKPSGRGSSTGRRLDLTGKPGPGSAWRSCATLPRSMRHGRASGRAKNLGGLVATLRCPAAV